MPSMSFISDFLKTQYNKLNEPVYLYSREKIIENCNRMKNCINYPDTQIHFATMANSNKDFLKIIKEQKFNVFVNSLMHLELAETCGYQPNQIMFTASSIDYKLLDLLHKKNIHLNLDSINQLNYWTKRHPDTAVGIRCNPIHYDDKVKKTRAGYFIGKESRLGITTDEIQSIQNKDKINGLHIYVGTDILDIDYFFHFYELLTRLALDFPSLEYLDFGGGFGVNEHDNSGFNFDKYGEGVTEFMNKISEKNKKSIKLILEPGRIIGGNSGLFITRVIDTKDRNKKQVAILNSSIVQFPRPLFYGEKTSHPVYVFDKKGNIKESGDQTCMIVGCSTYSRDIFINKIKLTKIETGDYIVFGNAGAYCSSSYTQFLGFKKPKELFI